jgi:hypothetical protein
MSSDDLVLSLQRATDRLVRRLRLGDPPAVTRRRFLIVQIDGLSRAVLERGLAAGHMPFLRRLLRQGYRLQPMTVGLPTSTPAFQMAAMYGVRPDIPGFHYYDRERREDVHFPRAGHAARVEEQQAAGRRGILEGGSAYGCVFTGGATNNLFTLTSLTRPSGRGVLAALSPIVVLLWVCVKGLVRTVIDLARGWPRLAARGASRRQSWRWFTIRIGLGIWVRAFFTLSAARDLYAGTPAVYVNYLDYDEAAHTFGPHSRAALATLRRVDRAIRQLWRVARRVPEHQYDLYVLADHGQVACRAYRELAGGQRFEQWIFDRLLTRWTHGTTPAVQADTGLFRAMRNGSQRATGVFQQFLNYLNEDTIRRPDPEAHQQDGVRVISAGPNAFLYVVDADGPLDIDALERRFPGLAPEVSRSPGVGFVLARSRDGAVCFRGGRCHRFRDAGSEPFADRDDAALVVEAIEGLMQMPSAGDLVIYGIDAPQGNVSFIPEWGAHAGPSADEMHTFIVHPPTVTLPSPIDHPIRLYDHFIRYREGITARPTPTRPT